MRQITLQHEQSSRKALPAQHKEKSGQMSIEQQIEAVLHGMDSDGSSRLATKQAEQHLASVLGSIAAKHTTELTSSHPRPHPEAHVAAKVTPTTVTVCEV